MSKLSVLVTGSGGREHALAWKIAQSPLVEKIYCAPGNAGTAALAENVDIGAEEIDRLAAFAKGKGIGLTVVGPEAALCAGIVDRFNREGLTVFGPTAAAAQLEGSKAFMKQVLTKAGVPTARHERHTDHAAALAALGRFGERVVVKADGLAAGKGVTVCQTRAQAEAALHEAMLERAFGAAGDAVVIEEFLDGEEASILAFCDSERLVMMPACQDHKRVGDGDTGPNTGGMGAYSPAPVITPELTARIERDVMLPTLRQMAAMGAPYRGVLYAGLMITRDGPKTLEFNCRFGDPECQPVMMRMGSDLVPVLLACANGSLEGVNVAWSPRAAVCVVMAAGGYPGAYAKGTPIMGLERAGAVKDVMVYHAGTKVSGSNVVTNGGRVLGVTASGATIREAIDRAYEAAGHISWDGAQYRRDIGRRALER